MRIQNLRNSVFGLALALSIPGCQRETKSGSILDIYNIASAETADLRRIINFREEGNLVRVDYDFYRSFPGSEVTVSYIFCFFSGVPHISRHPFVLNDKKKAISYFNPNIDRLVDDIKRDPEFGVRFAYLRPPCDNFSVYKFTRPTWFDRFYFLRRGEAE